MASNAEKSRLFPTTVSKRIESIGPLYQALRAGGTATFADKKFWDAPSKSLKEASELGQQVPIIFSTNADPNYAFGWAVLTSVEKLPNRYTFSNLVEFREPVHFDDLPKYDLGSGTKIGTRQTTSRPYNLIPTPYDRLKQQPDSQQTTSADSKPRNNTSDVFSTALGETNESPQAEVKGLDETPASTNSGANAQKTDSSEPVLLSSPEGKRLLKLHIKRERKTKLAKAKKRLVQTECGCFKCVVCDFDFSERYGPHGDGFIECHHTKPLSDRLEEEETHLEDLELVCANCHRMLHRGKVMLSIPELRVVLRPTN